MLTAAYPKDVSDSYSPVLIPLYHHFTSTLYDVCSPFIKDPHELAYIAAARWPGFVRPILDEYQRLRRNATGNLDMGEGQELELAPPSEDARIRLIRLFTPSFTAALEALYPRISNAADWAGDNQPRENLFSSDISSMSTMIEPNTVSHAPEGSMTETLPRLSKFILIAAFLASTNPQKTDMRMFGRGPDERKKKRRRGGTTEPKKGGAIKVCSYLEVIPPPTYLCIDSSTTVGANAISVRQNDLHSRNTSGRVRCR
jgi:origin recognition complex subunit 5